MENKTLIEQLYSYRYLYIDDRDKYAKIIKATLKIKLATWLEQNYGITRPRISVSIYYSGDNPRLWMSVTIQTDDRKNTVIVEGIMVEQTEGNPYQMWNVKTHYVRNCASLLEPFPTDLIDYTMNLKG